MLVSPLPLTLLLTLLLLLPTLLLPLTLLVLLRDLPPPVQRRSPLRLRNRSVFPFAQMCGMTQTCFKRHFPLCFPMAVADHRVVAWLVGAGARVKCTVTWLGTASISCITTPVSLHGARHSCSLCTRC